MSSFTATIDLPGVPSSVPLARRLVRDVLRSWSAPQDREDAELLVSELVANVVDHADGSSLTLELVLAGARLRIAAVDGSAVQPVIRALSHVAERGRGMQLIAGIAHRWGVEDHDGGKRVWFELSPAQRETPGLPSGSGGEGRSDSDRSTKES